RTEDKMAYGRWGAEARIREALTIICVILMIGLVGTVALLLASGILTIAGPRYVVLVTAAAYVASGENCAAVRPTSYEEQASVHANRLARGRLLAGTRAGSEMSQLC